MMLKYLVLLMFVLYCMDTRRLCLYLYCTAGVQKGIYYIYIVLQGVQKGSVYIWILLQGYKKAVITPNAMEFSRLVKSIVCKVN